MIVAGAIISFTNILEESKNVTHWKSFLLMQEMQSKVPLSAKVSRSHSCSLQGVDARY